MQYEKKLICWPKLGTKSLKFITNYNVIKFSEEIRDKFHIFSQSFFSNFTFLSSNKRLWSRHAMHALDVAGGSHRHPPLWLYVALHSACFAFRYVCSCSSSSSSHSWDPLPRPALVMSFPCRHFVSSSSSACAPYSGLDREDKFMSLYRVGYVFVIRTQTLYFGLRNLILLFRILVYRFISFMSTTSWIWVSIFR